ncbi:MAG TPA: hypothetical protein VF525_19055 [Pyrinomonadaceae bacterium]|jgi:hypothetical protein
MCLCDPETPIVIDVAGNGFNFTDTQHGVRFDIKANGTLKQIPWTATNADDAWLVLDRDGNGTIDSGKELFGAVTEQPATGQPNGFSALASFDAPSRGGNSDGVIDRRDAIFAALRLWQDVNHNGISEADELHPLPSLDVQAIQLNYREARRRDESGNVFRYRSKVVDQRGAGPMMFI